MKKKIISVISMMSLAALLAVTAHAQAKPTIIVDERELAFADQEPIIVPETSRTLIPLRFVLESVGATVTWNGDAQTVTVNSGDNRNRVVLTIGSDEMKMFYYPTVKDVIMDTQKLDQVPILMNDRTMIPVRAVLEAIGAIVDWDEANQIIHVTSRAYSRYLRDMGVEGYDVSYPLSGGKVTFDQPKVRDSQEPYVAKKDLPAISISTEAKNVSVGETFDVYINMNNIDKIGADALLTTMTVTFKYDSTKIAYDGYIFVKDAEEYESILDAVNSSYLNNSLKIASIANLGLEETNPTPNGAIAKVTFEVISDEPTELSLFNRSHPMYGDDIGISFISNGETIMLNNATQLYIDTTPIVINAE